MVRLPPSSVARSRIPTIPSPEVSRWEGIPIPSSWTSSSSSPLDRVMRTATLELREWRRTFFRDSSTILKAAISRFRGRRPTVLGTSSAAFIPLDSANCSTYQRRAAASPISSSVGGCSTCESLRTSCSTFWVNAVLRRTASAPRGLSASFSSCKTLRLIASAASN